LCQIFCKLSVPNRYLQALKPDVISPARNNQQRTIFGLLSESLSFYQDVAKQIYTFVDILDDKNRTLHLS
jgi:hypothetical protein